MKYLILFFLALTAHADPIRVAIVDTGLNLKDSRFAKVLCKTGHRDFTGIGLDDTVGHGTHVAGIIMSYAAKKNYCFVIYKYYGNNDTNLQNTIFAFKAAAAAKASIINFSGGGFDPSYGEYAVIRDNPQILFVVAGGNDNEDLDNGNYWYPASYRLPNIIVVGALDVSGIVKEKESNYASWFVWEVGESIFSTLPGGKWGYKSGTSMATALRTARIINTRGRK